ncbi:hypothetical protein [Fusobacterium sp.]|uniref:hypothetical protein n=1 Tax=Fusobacterium sp. TaxID=68766 RepID=UPI00290175D2|nr:hypothetical protein [Fusobacterium sp.]MDU1911504.1 hypothetical protein [Fusobacterium sp.]
MNIIKKIYERTKLIIIDLKLEVIVFILVFILNIAFKDGLILTQYFTNDRLSSITEFFSIVIAVYIAVITILGTSMIGITKKILEKKLDSRLINIIMFGIIEALLSILIITFIENSWFNYYYDVLLCLSITTLITFAKFIYLLSLIFKANLNSLAEKIDEDTKEDKENKEFKIKIYELLEKIEGNFKRNSK